MRVRGAHVRLAVEVHEGQLNRVAITRGVGVRTLLLRDRVARLRHTCCTGIGTSRPFASYRYSRRS